MFLSRSEYDRGVNTFSPAGRLFQIEYSMEAIKLGSTAIGIQTSEGVVVAVEKRIQSTLLEPDSIEKIFEIDEHIACAVSGLMADSRTLVDHARVQSTWHKFTYDEQISVEGVTQSMCDLELSFGEREGKMARPFGVACLIFGVDANGPVLFHTDPSGTYTKFLAKAVGSASEGAQVTLEEKYNKSLSLAEAETLALEILKDVMEEKLTSTNVDMAIVKAETRKIEIFDNDRLDELIQRI